MMAIELTNPERLPKHDLYQQVAVATGSKTVYMAGQVAWDANGVTVGLDDLTAQTEQCYLNVATALAAVKASFADVAKLTLYVVALTPEKMPLLLKGIAQASEKLGIAIAAPLTGIGVAALSDPEHLIEVEAIAVFD